MTVLHWLLAPGRVDEALSQRAQMLAPVPDTGTVHGDLTVFLEDTFLAAAQPTNRRKLRHIMGSAQHDDHIAQSVTEFTAARRTKLRTLFERGKQRGELPSTLNIDLLIDQAYGVLWYRLLVGHAPLDEHAAHELADALAALAEHAELAAPSDS